MSTKIGTLTANIEQYQEILKLSDAHHDDLDYLANLLDKRDMMNSREYSSSGGLLTQIIINMPAMRLENLFKLLVETHRPDMQRHFDLCAFFDDARSRTLTAATLRNWKLISSYPKLLSVLKNATFVYYVIDNAHLFKMEDILAMLDNNSKFVHIDIVFKGLCANQNFDIICAIVDKIIETMGSKESAIIEQLMKAILPEDMEPIIVHILDRGCNIAQFNGALSVMLSRIYYSNDLDQHYCISALNCLFDRGADVNTLDTEHGTLLHRAVKSRFSIAYDIVKLLLNRGAKVNVVHDFQTPLNHAIHCVYVSESTSLMELLISHGASVHPVCDGHRPPMISAVKETFAEDKYAAVGLLCEHGAQLNIMWGNQPIWVYVQNLRSKNFEYLRKLGMDFTVECPQTGTVYDYAVYHDTYELIDNLLNARIPVKFAKNHRAIDKYIVHLTKMVGGALTENDQLKRDQSFIKDALKYHPYSSTIVESLKQHFYSAAESGGMQLPDHVAQLPVAEYNCENCGRADCSSMI